jgi:hypothetical protein
MRKAGLVPIVLLSCGAIVGVGASDATAALAGSISSAGPSQRTIDALVQRAKQSGPVEAAEVASGSAEAAERSLSGQPVVPRGEPAQDDLVQPPTEAPSAGTAAAVSVVSLHGHFVEQLGKVPLGGKVPSGTTMAFILDAAEEVAAVYVGDRSPELSTVGVVEQLVPAGAITARAASRTTGGRRRRSTFRPGRGRAHIATWGSNCKSATNHCYALAEWAMHGGEMVEGTQSSQRTTNMNVPGWEKGYFVDNEEWANFTGTERWVEIGQQAGEFKGCCGLWWFYAMSFGPHEYAAFVGPPYVSEVAANAWNNYGLHSIGSGDWCFMIGAQWETSVACYGGFDTYSKDLQDGAEVATETKPVNAGSVNVNAQWTDGTYHVWNFAENKKTTAGLCATDWASPSKGDVNYGTC